MVLNSFDNVSKTALSKLFFSHDHVHIVDTLGDVGEVTFVNITGVYWVAIKSLVVWNWPGWGSHHSETMVSLRVDGGDQRVLTESSGCSLNQLLLCLHVLCIYLINN